ncbi:MAG: minor capsid protein [Clostridium sp.]
MSNRSYWEKREAERLAIVDDLVNKQLKLIEGILDSSYKKIETDIYRLYNKYANDNKLSYQETLIYLGNKDRREFQKNLKDYTELYRDKYTASIYKADLQSLSVRARVKRLEVLQSNIKIASTELENILKGKTLDLFKDVYRESYFFNMFSMDGFVDNLGLRFDIISPRLIEELLKTPWSGTNYSDKIWNISNDFTRILNATITAGLIRGEHPNKIASDLRNKMLGKKKNGKRTGGSLAKYKTLVRTEAAFIAEQATKRSYEDAGIEEYEYLATLDLRTSEMCQALDGKKFKTKDIVTGKNYPPLHPHCRSTTVPVVKWDGEEDTYLSYRHARNPVTGKNTNEWYDTTYPQWKKKMNIKYDI